jgi:hypothetical protein
VAALVIAVVGPGEISLDAVLGIDDDLSGWTGAMIYGLGLLAGAGQLALLWRRPDRVEAPSE